MRAFGNLFGYSWAAFCILAAGFGVTDSAYNVATKVFLVAIFGAAAPVPLIGLRYLRRRASRRQARPRPTVVRDTPKGLSATDRIAFGKLMDAYDEANRLADAGLVPRRALTDVSARISQLGLLLRADTRSLRLGGRLSVELRLKMRELTTQLVALVDLVVDREASAMEGPVGLREALEIIEAHARAEGELRDLI